jgi:hypothetical protein
MDGASIQLLTGYIATNVREEGVPKKRADAMINPQDIPGLRSVVGVAMRRITIVDRNGLASTTSEAVKTRFGRNSEFFSDKTGFCSEICTA